MKTKHYHNTNKLDQITARLEAKKNLKQEDWVYKIFKTAYLSGLEKKLSASDVWNFYSGQVGMGIGKPNTPLTSIRRAISDLMREGILEKTNETKIGIYGKPEHFYRLSQIKIEPYEEEIIYSCCNDEMTGMYLEHQICPTCKEHQ